MIEGDISWTFIGTKSSSRSMGTKTMAERAVSNGIISSRESSRDCCLPIAKYVSMALQNKYPELFSNKNRRKQAMAIVEQAVEEYFVDARKNVN